ncbi:MAG: 23S rRNA (guanosine(2251)-2'-O)-methyltransferase RlmB [Prolixibacteraceae bacterium]|nr:23S rRNA (guanosine(2251)-2'-O)-methyltransferase RlmB [Prolixibacteraceae bacterium]
MDKEDYIFGTRAVIEAIRNGRSIDKILIKKGIDNELFNTLFPLIKENNVNFQFVPAEKISRITRKNHQGVLAFLSPVDFADIEIVLPGLFEEAVNPLILMLDRITDVRNFGAIVRSAECGGVNAVIVPEKGMARIGADAVKTSAGALNYLPVCKSPNLKQTLQFLKNSGIRIVAASEKADTLFTDAKMNVPLCIIVGAEDKGISPAILQMADEQVRIPLSGKIDSLNVSVAAGLMIFEAVRQRNLPDL